MALPKLLRVLLLFLLQMVACGAQATTLEQVISHEQPAFQTYANSTRLTVGKDGRVYVGLGTQPTGYLLRLDRDGGHKAGGVIAYCARNFAANAEGVIATADAHFTHAVTLYDPAFRHVAANNDFINNDQVGWDSPIWVEAGASGDFYALDLSRNRILRLRSDGKLITVYPMRDPSEELWGYPLEMRVCEKTGAFYWLVGGAIRCVGLDGKTRWSVPANNLGGTAWDGYHGAFDVDNDGAVYILRATEETIQRYTPTGQADRQFALQMGDLKPTQDYAITDLRVVGDEVVLKRHHPTELFQCYRLDTGVRRSVTSIDYEKLTVTYPGDVWTAGATIPFHVALTGSGKVATPKWRVWVRPFASADYQECALVGDTLRVPANLVGLYDIKVSPETQPWQHGAVSEYLVHAVVQIRSAGTKGTASLLLPENRTEFAQGETVACRAILRAAPSDLPASVTIRLRDGERVLAEGSIVVPAGQSSVAFTLPAKLTYGLRPGSYMVEARAAGLTAAMLPFHIGAATSSLFHYVLYGDYSPTYPTAEWWNGPDIASSRADRAEKLGFNLMVDRLGHPGQFGALTWENPRQTELTALEQRLQADTVGVAPEVARLAPPLLETLSGYSARGINQMAILLGNDAGLPLGTGFDTRKPSELTEAITRVTTRLLPYPAFRGWSWASNWWFFAGNGAAAAHDPATKAAYETAIKRARETGVWEPVLDTVSNIWMHYVPDAETAFADTLRSIAPEKVTAAAAPYRNVFAYPPVTFNNVQETDLQIQWEQVPVPYHAPHNVDFYSRPGKPAWAHPEVWNDSGTGEQILPTLFDMVMRGADGVGLSGDISPWGAQPEDSRQAYQGTASVVRALGGLLRQYGPWLTTLENNDRVAIIADGRMFKIDDWPNVWGTHFARVAEAYTACLFAHSPASIVFVEDITADTLKKYKAILLVDQRVEMEPALGSALAAAHIAGIPIFSDDTCRPALVKEFAPLGVAFNKFEKDPSPASDDSANWRFESYGRADGQIIAHALAASAPPLVQLADDRIFVSERKNGEGRFLFVVNHSEPAVEPGQLWHVGLRVSSCLPVLTSFRIADSNSGDNHYFVYDMFALRRVPANGGVVEADLRTLPARLFAILPAPINSIVLHGPKALIAGRRFGWFVQVLGPDGPIAASIPVHVQLLSSSGAVLAETYDAADAAGLSGTEQFAATDAAGIHGTFVMPWNAPASCVLVATELCSGRRVRLSLNVALPTAPFSLANGEVQSPETPIEPKTIVFSLDSASDLQPAEAHFGPHIRDMVVTANGRLAVMNTMNWDQNLYAVDVATGAVRWRRQLGHQFAYAPQALADGLAVQAFDFTQPEGYHLYLGGDDGKFTRRFALYGLARRLPHRFVSGMFNDRINQFAASPDGAWVATAGDLGIAVWSRAGKLLWTHDLWKTTHYEARFTGMDSWAKARLSTPLVAAIDPNTLLVIDGMTATGYRAMIGKVVWQLTLASTGEARKVAFSADHRLLALLATTEGGRLFLVRAGKLVWAIPTAGEDVDVASDGSAVAVVTANQVKLYAPQTGLEWSFAGDADLRFPRFSPDGQRLVVSSDLGEVYVLNRSGHVLFESDREALAVPAWLPNGDLLLGTWMGALCRLDRAYHVKWKTHLTPTATDMRAEILRAETIPTSRVTGWGNAAPHPAPLTPNLLVEAKADLVFQENGKGVDWAINPHLLMDGSLNAPPTPLLRWTDISWLGEGSAFNYLQMSSNRGPMQVTGITLVEDAAHPESWVRDAYLEAWDAKSEKWVFLMPLLSNSRIHTHRLPQTAEATRFRIVFPPGLVGNLRLGEIVLHGKLTTLSSTLW